MPVVLKKGAWREFKIFLLLKGYATGWDLNISRKIFMILQGGEIRKRFICAFPPLSKYEKLDISLDDIINPIEILEKKSHRKGCHPGRLTLDPERYNRAWSDNRNGDPGYVYPRGETPPHMRAGFLATPWGKHRLLDVSEDIEHPHRKALSKDVYQQRDLRWGLQDMYFLGGVPLEYWCNGDSMGMHVRPSLPSSETYQWVSTAFRAQTHEEGGGGGLTMIEDGLFQQFPMDSVWGMHNWPGMNEGSVAVHKGSVMAAADKFEVTINGNGGHAAMPQATNDPILKSKLPEPPERFKMTTEEKLNLFNKYPVLKKMAKELRII